MNVQQYKCGIVGLRGQKTPANFYFLMIWFIGFAWRHWQKRIEYNNIYSVHIYIACNGEVSWWNIIASTSFDRYTPNNWYFLYSMHLLFDCATFCLIYMSISKILIISCHQNSYGYICCFLFGNYWGITNWDDNVFQVAYIIPNWHYKVNCIFVIY